MRRRLIGAAALLALVVSSGAAVKAEVTPAEINKRKLLLHSYLLQIYIAQKKRQPALAEYAIVVGFNPNDARLRFAYGSYIAHGNTPADYNAALVQLKKALELEPGNQDYSGAIGKLLVRMKKNEEAIPYLRNGGPSCKKLYEDIWRIKEYEKKQNEYKKKQDEYKKQIELQKKKQEGSAPGASDDDDW